MLCPGSGLLSRLERHRVGLDLVAELRAVHCDPARPAASLAELLDERRGAVLARGLSARPRARLRRLLRSPAFLLELQELVLIQRGPHWERLPRSAELTRAVERTKEPCCRETLAPTPRLRIAWHRRPWLIGLATAAVALLAVYLPRWLNPPPQSSLSAPRVK